ncbi:hypothetical protein [Anaerosporobacter sp.]|uniref:hypothetical protein n=1 Tax=Anaerosporobacter sp. TaxID=1872529 RepID=UPI00286F7BFF|nr:hypothetical protein [Anaerosporobacter sp.]
MDDVLNTSFFGLLAESSQEVTNEEMQSAYAQFIANMEAVSNSDDYTRIFRTLNVSRIEMAHLQTVFRYEQGEKCPEVCLPAKSLILS